MKSRRPGPFSRNVRDIVRKTGQMREVEFTTQAPERWGEGLVSVEKGSPVIVQARFESVHEGILVTAEAQADFTGECGRCLTALRDSLRVEFQELFAYPGEEEADLEVQDDHVDLETEVRDAIVLSLPFQPVCRPDCPGLDPDTGEPADGSSSDVRETLDPRWAALAGLKSDDDSAADADNSTQT